MAKEINTRNKININNIVYFFGDDLDIYYSLESLSLETKKFRLQKKEFTKKIDLRNKCLLLDDSCRKFNANIKHLQSANFNNYFMIVKKENAEISKNKSLKVFYKPLKIFKLYEEINFIISTSNINKHWNLDKAGLLLYKSKNENIKLTEKEYNFINFLLNQYNKTATKQTLLKKIWKVNIQENNQCIETRVVETMVSRIRKKLSSIKEAPRLVKTKEGYKILV